MVYYCRKTLERNLKNNYSRFFVFKTRLDCKSQFELPILCNFHKFEKNKKGKKDVLHNSKTVFLVCITEVVHYTLYSDYTLWGK